MQALQMLCFSNCPNSPNSPTCPIFPPNSTLSKKPTFFSFTFVAMELSKNYIPSEVEDKWYQHWLKKGYFKSAPDNRPPFSVVIPPPNVTGVLHMGHTLNETVQDILVRKARMSGFNACWVPGSDHASIATEAKVVEMLKKEKNIDKKDLSREEFLAHAFEWKEKYGGIIYNQLAKLGCSADWDRVSFTMDDHYYKAVIKVFVDLYKKGLVYRGARMINWDPAAKTALSDEEVEYREVTGVLYYIKYEVAEGQDDLAREGEGDLALRGREAPRAQNPRAQNPIPQFIVIATQRPETIMGDTAVCANPGDERYSYLKGKSVIIPLLNKTIPVIFDEYVDREFGTGILKITPAHDINDYNIGLKHNLPVIDTLDVSGNLSAAAQIYVGEERFAARKKIVNELKKQGLLVREEEYQTRMGYSQRTNVVAEPKISTQWFVKMSELAEPALKEVINGNVTIHPGERFLATYKYWLENVKDWCISRQLWWGQQIPAWYDAHGNMFVAETEAEAMKEYGGEGNLKRDEDVLDTWFSSWLWPIEVFKGISKPGNADIEYYYPTAVLVTGQDIIFFWVARMIMAGMDYLNEKPFSDVYFTGMVRDKQGRKMSKQLGNSPDLLALIEKYGADAVRFGIMISSPAGNDLLFDEASLEQGKHFNNKLWNVLKLIQMWKSRIASDTEVNYSRDNFSIKWFESRLEIVKEEVDILYKQFRLSEALKTIYSLIWDDFCSWYLEWVKPGFEEAIDESVYDHSVRFFEDLLQLLHPFMPFITEEIFHLLKEQDQDLVVKQFATASTTDASILAQGDVLKEVITSIRDARNKNKVKPKEKISLHIDSDNQGLFQSINPILSKQLNATISFTSEQVPNTISVVVNKDTFYLGTETQIDSSAQKKEMLKDLEYLKGFLLSVEKKLSNERFVQNAKAEVIELERKKKSDAETRIKLIEESLLG